jgi:hypothetical protein
MGIAITYVAQCILLHVQNKNKNVALPPLLQFGPLQLSTERIYKKKVSYNMKKVASATL